MLLVCSVNCKERICNPVILLTCVNVLLLSIWSCIVRCMFTAASLSLRNGHASLTLDAMVIEHRKALSLVRVQHMKNLHESYMRSDHITRDVKMLWSRTELGLNKTCCGTEVWPTCSRKNLCCGNSGRSVEDRCHVHLYVMFVWF